MQKVVFQVVVPRRAGGFKVATTAAPVKPAPAATPQEAKSQVLSEIKSVASHNQSNFCHLPSYCTDFSERSSSSTNSTAGEDPRRDQSIGRATEDAATTSLSKGKVS